jgi:blocked-early-in-transport protein 1
MDHLKDLKENFEEVFECNYSTFRGNQMSNRNALFGNRQPGPNDQSYVEPTRTLYEEENNRQTTILNAQVARLKYISIQINDEVGSQNNLIDNMGGTFGQTGQLMSGALKKLKHMIDTGGSKHMCYLISFVVALFFVL